RTQVRGLRKDDLRVLLSWSIGVERCGQGECVVVRGMARSDLLGVLCLGETLERQLPDRLQHQKAAADEWLDKTRLRNGPERLDGAEGNHLGCLERRSEERRVGKECR